MTKETKTRERYFVGRVGDGWNKPSKKYTSLSSAIRKAFECEVTGDFKGGSGPIFIAKEISYELEVDERTGKVKVKPVGDIKSNWPYYLIKDVAPISTYARDWDADCHSVTSDKNLQKLIAKAGLPKLGRNIHLAHGLELKIGENKHGKRNETKLFA